jgi:signal transduction histidine kinase
VSRPIAALFIGAEPQLSATVRCIGSLERHQTVAWTIADQPDVGATAASADVVVVDERMWTGEVRRHLSELRERIGTKPIVLLCAQETALLGPELLGVEGLLLVERSHTAIQLPSLLAWLGASGAQASAERKQILIIDDSPDDRELYKRALQRTTQVYYGAIEAEDGPSGIELLRNIDPDCVLLDYSLPGRNGVEVLRDIRSEWPDVPIVILTGQGNEAVAVEAMKIGAQDYVIKSQLDGDTLHRVIYAACETRALQRRVVQQRDTLELFTRALAHDLNEPLRTIRSYVDIVRTSGQLSERNVSFLGTVSSAAQHMERLVGMVTHYARLEADRFPAERELCDAHELVEQALKNLAQHRSDVKHELTIEALPRVCCNPVQLTNVFQNLIGNALNYGDKATTRIRVSCRTEELHHIFTVEDNGSGIDPRHTHLLFQPFKRLRPGVTRGSGLGLALCKKIIEIHQGRICVESSLGHGTKVHFSIPTLAQSDRVPSEASPPLLSKSDPAPERELANVLLVEDNEADVVLTQVLLQEQDGLELNIHSVSNGELALQWLMDPSKPHIDLVLLDINMPVMDGFTFLQSLRLEPRHARTPVIMCSTSEEPADLTKARGFGVAAYVTKPVRLPQLEDALHEIDSLVLSREHGAPRLERKRPRPRLSTPATR